MDSLLTDLVDQNDCYHKLVGLLHPGGLSCPACEVPDHLRVHRRHLAPVLDYRCTAWGRVFNAFTGTAFEGTHRRPAEVMLILRGFAQSVPSARLARDWAATISTCWSCAAACRTAPHGGSTATP